MGLLSLPLSLPSAMAMKEDLEQLMQSKYSAICQLFPSNWKDIIMRPSPWQDVELVQLQTSSPDLKQVGGKFHLTCNEAEWRIVKIERCRIFPSCSCMRHTSA